MSAPKAQLSDDEHAEYHASSSNVSAGRNKKVMTFRERRLSIPMQNLSTSSDDNNKVEQDTEEFPVVDRTKANAVSMKDRSRQANTAPPAQPTNEISKASPPRDDDNQSDHDDELEPDEEDYGYETHEPDSASYGGGGGDPHSHDVNASDGDLYGGHPHQQVMIEMDNHSTHSHQSIHSSHASEADEKALTFRKRRLSMTTTNSNSTGSGNQKSRANTSTNVQIVAPDQFSDNAWKRQRRLSHDSSICSATSFNSEQVSASAPPMTPSGKKPIKFVSRTLHAGEILPQNNKPPESPSDNSNSTLFRQQMQMQQQQILMAGSNGYSPQKLMLAARNGMVLPGFIPQPQQPRWKRRKTICHQTDAHKLPFAIDVVGTYSCHGVEPVYDSEFEDEEDEMQGNMPAVTMVAKINQDRGGVAFPYGNHPRTALFAVYDGHGQGGELISQFALYEVQRRLEKHPQFETNLSVALKETFLDVDDALNYENLIGPLFAGTTACVAVYRDSTLTLANAGDSRAVLGRRVQRGVRTSLQSPRHLPQSLPMDNRTGVRDYEYIALDLTQDQNPDVPAEMERILKMGGYVSLPPQPGLSARVWLDPHCTQIGLAMARSIGDHAISPAGVIAEPVVTTHEVLPEDEFMILASDGVWEFITSFQAVRIVAEHLSSGATKACQALIEAATVRWHEEEGAYRDDITAIVVQLKRTWNVASPNDGNVKNSETEVMLSTTEVSDQGAQPTLI